MHQAEFKAELKSATGGAATDLKSVAAIIGGLHGQIIL